MPRSATIIAMNEIALIRNAVDTPAVAITMPASAGPADVTVCTIALFSPTAFTTREGPTSTERLTTRDEPPSSTTKLWRAGLPRAFTAPRAHTSLRHRHGAATAV